MSISAVPDAGTAPNPAPEETPARDHAEPAPRERPRPAQSIEAELETLFAERPARLVFDLSALDFIDSSGIAVLLRAAEKIDQLELRNPSTIVRRVIVATGLSDVLPVEP